MAAHLRKESDAPTQARALTLYSTMYRLGQRIWPQGRVGSTLASSSGLCSTVLRLSM